MSIIFCGDLVLPYYVTVDYKEVVPLFVVCIFGLLTVNLLTPIRKTSLLISPS